MTINGRLLLLVVVTGLFVRLWATNDRPRARSKALARSQVTYRMPPPDPAPRVATAPAIVKEVVVRPAAVATKPIPSLPVSSLEETWTEFNCPIPLPAGISSGMYRVVDDSGRVARLEIGPSLALDQNVGATTVAADFLMTTSGSSRWYFIRLQAVVAPPLFVQSPHVSVGDFTPIPTESSASDDERPPFTNRKFDFTGYVTTNWTAAPDPEEIARPDPPDLPLPR